MKIGFDFSTSFLWEIYKNWISASNKSPGPCPCIYFKRLFLNIFKMKKSYYIICPNIVYTLKIKNQQFYHFSTFLTIKTFRIALDSCQINWDMLRVPSNCDSVFVNLKKNGGGYF